MQVMPERWTDDRLDDLRGEMDEEPSDEILDAIMARFDDLKRTLIGCYASLIVAFLAYGVFLD